MLSSKSVKNTILLFAVTFFCLFLFNRVQADTVKSCSKQTVEQLYSQHKAFQKASNEGDLTVLEKIRTSKFFSEWKEKLQKLDRWKDASDIVMQGAEWLEDFNSLTFMRCDKSGDIARLVHYKEVEYKGYEIEGDGLKEVTNSAMKYNINMFRKEGGVWKVGYAMDSQVPVEEFSSEEVPQSAYGSRTEFGLK